MIRFSQNTQVLLFDGARRGKKQHWVLYPVCCWSVLVPLPRNRQLNIFQMAVLRLIRAGIVEIVEIANKLKLEKDLIFLIREELLAENLITLAHDLTVKGLKELSDFEEKEEYEPRRGYIFSDPFTGDILPRFIEEELAYADIENSDKWFIVDGTHGNPRKEYAFSIPCNLPMVHQPTPRDIIQAISKQRKRQKFQKIQQTELVDSVTFISDTPEAFYLALDLKLEESSGDWVVNDPFQHGNFLEMRKLIKKQAENNSHLRSYIHNLLGKGNEEHKHFIDLQKDAADKLEERLGIAITSHTALYDELVSFERAILEAKIDSAPKNKWKTVSNNMQTTLECLFATMFTPYKFQHTLSNKINTSDSQYVREYLIGIAEDIGLSKLPRKLLSIGYRQISNAEQFSGASLRPWMALSLLYADEFKDFPIHRLRNQFPDLLNQIDAIAETRNKVGGHFATKEVFEQEIVNIQTQVPTIYTAVEILILNQSGVHNE